jgi:hypothetical protein
VKRRNRYLALVASLALLGASQTVAAGQTFPPHGHVLLHGAQIEFVEPQPGAPPYRILGFDRCTELANARKLPLHAHHDRVHFGQAGQAVQRGGLFVVPLDPLFPGIESCADLEAALPYPG